MEIKGTRGSENTKKCRGMQGDSDGNENAVQRQAGVLGTISILWCVVSQ
jgi:hypothetical protein